MIRPAKSEDIPRLLELGQMMIQDSAYSVFSYSEEKISSFLPALITHGFAWVYESGGKVRGLMLGDVVSPWYSVDRMGIEYLIYIDPQYRSGLVASKLIFKWMSWCKEQGAIQIRPGVSTGDDSISRLYERLGFGKTGATYALNVAR